MKKILIILFLFSACTNDKIDLSEKSQEEIIAADKAMSDLAVKEGFHKALLEYATDDVIKTQEGEFPVIGKPSLIKYWSGNKVIKEITWEPFKAEASKSGDLGYTIGNWKFVTLDSTYYGNYYTFWRKQPDGSWKFTFDAGNGTPDPNKK